MLARVARTDVFEVTFRVGMDGGDDIDRYHNVRRSDDS